ncbi:hypothetical protein QQF64_009583 [Cirrhinus molitorella]|uniref:CCHC-type domain-containing protein n=1 Tax=Cirrhinus molitorella TaxID=172907 RepID=A0ABR3M3X4_9TELE
MDTAEEDEMRRALIQQGALLGRQQEEIAASRCAYTEISLQLNQLAEWLDQLHTNPPATQMGEQPVSNYSIEFRTLAASCGWNDKALWDHFLFGLAEHIKDEIYSLDLPSSLDGLIDLAIRVDNRLSLRSRHRRWVVSSELTTRVSSSAFNDTPTQRLDFSEDEPMQVGRARLTVKERRRRLDNQLCLYCGEAGHVVAACPAARQRSPHKGGQKVSVTRARLPPGGRSELQASLLVQGAVYQVSALIDSGAEGDFMDVGLARRLGIPSIALAEPISARTLCGTSFFRITHATEFVTLTLSGNHAEEIRCAPRACPLTSLTAPTIKKHAHQRTTLKPTTHPKSPTPDTAHSHLCFRFVCFVCASFSRSVSVSGLSLPHCVEMSRTTDPVGHWEDLEAWLSAMTDSLLPKAAETLRHQTQDQLGDSLTSIMKHDPCQSYSHKELAKISSSLSHTLIATLKLSDRHAANLQKELTRAQLRIKQLEMEVQERHEGSDETDASAKKEIARLQEALTTTTQEREQAQSAYAELASKLQYAEQLLEKAKTDFRDKTSRIKALETHLNEARTEIDHLTQQLDHITEESDNVKDELKHAYELRPETTRTRRDLTSPLPSRIGSPVPEWAREQKRKEQS